MPRKSNRRELIINVATTRFLISGYDVVTVDELCELSSSTKGSFYHFFPNKESLAVDVVNHVWHQTQANMGENFLSDLGTEQKLDEEIERVASSYLRFDGKRYFIGCPVGTLAVSLRGKSLKLTRRLNFALTHMRQFYQDAYEEGLNKREIQSTVSAGDLASRLQISLQGLSTLGKAYGNNSKIKEMADQLKATKVST
jgi:TetR/AcrR family transcriptional repressor of nem operon